MFIINKLQDVLDSMGLETPPRVLEMGGCKKITYKNFGVGYDAGAAGNLLGDR